MLKFIATIDWRRAGQVLMVTLTYPDEIADRVPAKRTTDRGLFLRVVEAYFGCPMPVLWRMEWQERKSGAYKGKLLPHFHLVVFGIPFMDWRVIRGAWAKVLDWDGPLATDVRKSREGAKAAIYVAKYCGKVLRASCLDNGSYLNRGGRSWGMCRATLIPRHRPWLVPNLTERQLAYVRKNAALKIPNFDPDRGGSFCLLGPLHPLVQTVIYENGIDNFLDWK